MTRKNHTHVKKVEHTSEFLFGIYCRAYDYSCADWGGLQDHLRDIPREDIFKLSASAAASEFCEWVQVGIDVLFLIISIRPSATHLYDFQLLVLLP